MSCYCPDLSSQCAGTIAGDASYETGPVPVVEHNGRIYRAFERLAPPFEWGVDYQAVVVHAPLYQTIHNVGTGEDVKNVPTNLLDPEIWKITEPLPFDVKWLDQVCMLYVICILFCKWMWV